MSYTKLCFRSLCSVALICLSLTAEAQFFDRLTKPTIPIDLEHPPELGLQVDRLVFGPAEGQCSDEIIQELIADFVSNGIEVIDRANLDMILAEHNFNFSGHVDNATAAQLGKLLGPSAMLVVKVQRCATDTQRTYETVERYNFKTKSRYNVRIYRSRTSADIKTSVQTIDLTTGRIFSARTFNYSPYISYKSEEGYPEYPDAFDVLDRGYKSTVRAVNKMFLPWTENIELVFYNDKKCDLRSAYGALQAGLIDRAHELSEQNLQTCQNTPKVRKGTLANAYYNVGMTRMLRREYDDALEALYKASELKPGEITTEAIANTQKAKTLAQSFREMETEMEISRQQRDATESQSRQIAEASTLNNTAIIDMVKGGLPKAIIIKKITTSECRFDTTASGLLALTNAGVDNDIVIAMMDAQ